MGLNSSSLVAHNGTEQTDIAGYRWPLDDEQEPCGGIMVQFAMQWSGPCLPSLQVPVTAVVAMIVCQVLRCDDIVPSFKVRLRYPSQAEQVFMCTMRLNSSQRCKVARYGNEQETHHRDVERSNVLTGCNFNFYSCKSVNLGN